MKWLITILLMLCSRFANCQTESQWRMIRIDTLPCVFKVSSLKYEHAEFIAKKGYIVRLVISYIGDKMPCITDDSDCDYADRYKTITYLDAHKKELDEEKWFVWELKVIR